VSTTLAAVVATAYATYTYTQKHEAAKYQAIANRQYEREKLLKAKTAKARLQNKEPPSGSLVDDVIIEKVFLWECVDLRKRFPSSLTLNSMKISTNVSTGRGGTTMIRSPLLRRASSSVDNYQDEQQKQQQPQTATKEETPYNKLITDHECILADIVRKPNMPTHTVAYMRAGPRKLLHFNPQHVNAAIVTCGGLCPGLNK
jgi:6-phosphofructokinase 1